MSTYIHKARDPISSLTHMLGAVFFGAGTLVLLFKGLHVQAPPIDLLGASVFGLSLIALYTASAVYHFVPSGERLIAVLRRLDHSMIYVLIAGSYTPILLHFYPAPYGSIYTGVIWGIAALGILMRMLWFGAPRWLYTGFYILMGWFILIDLSALAAMGPATVALLVGGGVSYTLGGICYALKWPNISKSFGAHEFFHILVLLGSLQHYLIVLLMVL